MIFEGNKNQVRKKEKVYRKVKKNLRKSNLWVGESGVKYPSVLNLDQLRQSEFVDNAEKLIQSKTTKIKRKQRKKEKSWGNY